MSTRIKILDGRPNVDSYKGFHHFNSKLEFWPEIKLTNDAELRTFLLDARKEGLSFRFWSACRLKGDETISLHFGFKTRDDFLEFENWFITKTPNP